MMYSHPLSGADHLGTHILAAEPIAAMKCSAAVVIHVSVRQLLTIDQLP